jgi:hypothetical protein
MSEIRHIKDIESELWDMARNLSIFAMDGYRENLYTRLYLYHRPSENPTKPYHKPGDVCVAADMGGNYVLSHNEHIPRDKTADQLTVWIHAILRRLPII